MLQFEGDSDIPLYPYFEREVNSNELVEGITPEEVMPCSSSAGDALGKQNKNRRPTYQKTAKTAKNNKPDFKMKLRNSHKGKKNQCSEKVTQPRRKRKAVKLKSSERMKIKEDFNTKKAAAASKQTKAIPAKGRAKKNKKSKNGHVQEPKVHASPTKDIEPAKFEISYSQEKKQIRKKQKSKFSPLLIPLPVNENDKTKTNTEENDEIEECCLKYLKKIQIQPFNVWTKPVQSLSPLDHLIQDGMCLSFTLH